VALDLVVPKAKVALVAAYREAQKNVHLVERRAVHHVEENRRQTILPDPETNRSASSRMLLELVMMSLIMK